MNKAASKEIMVYGAADGLIAASDAESAAMVGKSVSPQQWMNLWNLECNVASACLAAAKVGAASFRAQYAASAELHKAFASAAYEKAGAA